METWGDPIEIEPASSYMSSWGVPYYDEANDLLYVFYTYNTSNETGTPYIGGGASNKPDIVGTIGYRVSDDKGLTWGSRSELVVPTTNIDERNVYDGAKILFWLFSVGVPQYVDGGILFGMAKVTDGHATDTEAFIVKVDIPPTAATLLPSGMDGDGLVPDSTFGATTVSEEPCIFVHDDGLITVIARTDRGYASEFWSTDGGVTFSRDWARQLDGVSYIPQPHSPVPFWQLPDGRFLLWHHNNSISGYTNNRHPVWYRLGERVGNRIRWGVHHLLTYTAVYNGQIVYPSMVVDGDDLVFAASDKGTGIGGEGIKLLRFAISDFKF